MEETSGVVLATAILAFSFIYLLIAHCIYLIAKKFEAPKEWRAYVPIINLILICEIVARPTYWALLCFVPIMNWFIISILWMDIADGLGRNRYLGVLSIMPPLNLIFFSYLAYSTQPPGWIRPEPKQ